MESLCKRCQAFDIQAFGTKTVWRWRGYRIADMQKSADEGCLFCKTVLWEARKRAALFHVVADPGDPAAISQDVAGRYYTNRRADSELFMSRIDGWLKSCSFHHRTCAQSLSGLQVHDQLPTRCVEVIWSSASPKLSTPDEMISITLRNTAGRNASYITLSHRWIPEAATCSTTKANLSERLQGGPFSPMPPLFTDTLLAAKLGIRYVWIDSLCIVQDDPGDWEEEAVRMADYYQESLFAVSGPSATSNSGLFTDPQETGDPDSRPPSIVRLPYRDKCGKHQGYFYLHPISYKGATRDRFRRELTKTELLSRGWVFQEWVLSRRIVCFTPSGLFLQCKEERPRTETGEVVYQDWKEDIDFADFSLKQSFIQDIDTAESEEHPHRTWHRMIEAYSVLNFTKAEPDRLVALSGIADESNDVDGTLEVLGHRGIYTADLWLSNIHQGLLWEKVENGSHRRTATIPTWSWASVNTPVKWATYHETLDRDNYLVKYGVEIHLKLIEVLNPSADNIEAIDEPSFVNGPPEIPGERDGDAAAADNPRNRYPILCVRAKLQPVILGGHFVSRKEAILMAKLTGRYPYAMFGEEEWRMVATPFDREHVGGWASLEHPDYRLDQQQEEGEITGTVASGTGHGNQRRRDVIYALHISLVKGIDGGMPLGYFAIGHHAYSVLFVRRVTAVADGFERVGVGRLVGREADRGFAEAVERTIKLV